MTFRADIHTHSTFSDGSFTPLQLLDEAKKIGLSGISITDHDTIDAYTDELFQQAKDRGILLLPGVEISTRYREHDIHILGYGIDITSSVFASFLEKIQERRRERNKKILQKLTQKKMPITEKDLLPYQEMVGPRKVIGRAHIAHIMMQKGYVKSMQEAFQLYLKEGASCFDAGNKFTPREAILEIQMAKGKAIIAHPHFINSRKLLKDLLEMPFDGLECYYAKLPLEQEKQWIDIAKKKDWIATGGSDFHGEMKPFIPLGCSWVGQEVFFKLLGK